MALRKNQSENDEVTSTLKRLGVSDDLDVIPLLKSPNSRRAAMACFVLGRAKKAIAPFLFDVLMGKRPSLWMPAAVALSQLESKRMIRPLILLMLDASRSARQRQAAAYGLSFTWSGLADPRHMPAVGDAFVTVVQKQDETPGLRGQAAEGLAYLFGPCAGARHDRSQLAYRKAGQELVTALSDPSAEVRFWSAFALGSMRYQAALPALQKIARTDKEMFSNWWTVGQEAADAVDAIKGRERRVRVKSGS